MNLFSIEICGAVFTIRLYPDRNYGVRQLGPRRRAWDVWYLSFLFEFYPFW